MTQPSGSGQVAAAGPVPAVAAVDVTKRFPGVLANDRVTFSAAKGEVHALLGENGAGKTTLCNVLTGLYRPDSGELRVDGKPVRFRSPRDAHEAGIFMVHQHLRLVESMSVAENVVLGWSRAGRFRINHRQVEQEVADVAARLQMPVDPTAKIWQLSLGERQRVEILKALYRGAHILILDEPTTVLTPQEAEQLEQNMRELAASGGTVIFISHKLPEVTAVADRVTVLRKGTSVATMSVAEVDQRTLATLMVGHAMANGGSPHREGHPGQTVLDVADVHATGDLGTEALRGVSLTVHTGEIVGVAGVAGNGQRELAEVIAGLRATSAGSVAVAGATLPPGDARAAIGARVAYIPEDRMGTGVAPNLSIADNLILKSYRDPAMRRGPLLRRKEAAEQAREAVARFDVRAPGTSTLVRQLSGGNVQRVLLARELSSRPQVLVAGSPTRGLDVAATRAVRDVLRKSASDGVGVLLISEDLDEVLELSDRIIVLYGGRVAGELPRAEADVSQLGLLMAGGSP